MATPEPSSDNRPPEPARGGNRGYGSYGSYGNYGAGNGGYGYGNYGAYNRGGAGEGNPIQNYLLMLRERYWWVLLSTLVFLKLVVIFVVVALGWVVGKLRWLGDNDPARTLANAAYYIFVPALLFRTTARLEIEQMPAATLVAFFVPALAVLLLVYGSQRFMGVNE